MPWIIIGDFNIIKSDEEKIGGLPLPSSAKVDFVDFIDNNYLYNLPFLTSQFTCWNQPCHLFGVRKITFKLKCLKNALKDWNFPIFGFKLLHLLRDNIKTVEITLQQFSLDSILNAIQKL